MVPSMTLRLRLILTIGAIALLLVIPALYAATQLSRLREIAADVTATHGAAYVAMGRLQARMTDIDRHTRNHVAFGEEDVALRRDSALIATETELRRLERAGYGDVSEAAAAQIARIGVELRRIDELVRAGEADAATAALRGAVPLFETAQQTIQDIASEIDTRSEGELAAAGRISAAALTTTLLALLACLFIAVLLGTWATHTLVQPIHRLKRAMAAVSAGEFVMPGGLPYDRSDEIGDLSRSFRGMTQQLSALDRMKADFMSIATHELKTPINVVGGYAELIQDGVYGQVNEQQQVALTSIQEQARILTQLVNQLLDISRLEAGGLKLEIAELDLAELFERIDRTFDVLARKQGIQFTVELDPAAPRTIPADGPRLRDQVIGNLLANALKFTPDGGEIRVRGRAEDDWFTIEVTDTGEGMPADQLPHVFDKYFQIGEHARSKGAGLGLTIAHDIVEEHHGTITVESEEGRGTTFCIRLPASRERMAAAAAALAENA
jgi:signal transduction histidine kinase